MNNSFSNSEVFEKYLQTVDLKFQEPLTAIRNSILATAPDLSEELSFNVHCFRRKTHILAIGVTKKYCSI